MVYLGRVIFAGLTPNRKPFSAYAISGRSEGSQKRRFELLPDGRVYVGNIGELTEWQREFAELIFYNCMRARDGTLFVTNGAQTDTNSVKGERKPTFYHDFSEMPADAIMQEWGYEPDKPIFTPRTALVKEPDNSALFSAAVKFDETSDGKYSAQTITGLSPAKAKVLATYKGIGNEAASWRAIRPYKVSLHFRNRFSRSDAGRSQGRSVQFH